MALIKCEECGQMVSDKAEACPHCGCPVAKLMACPECGNIIEGEESYCKNCGYPLASGTAEQTANITNQDLVQEGYYSEDDERGNGRLWLWLTLAALALIGGTAAWLYWQNRERQDNPEAMDSTIVTVVEESPVDSTEANAIDSASAVKEQYEEAEPMDADTYDGSYQNADIEEVKQWIQGNWRYRMVTEFGPMETRIGINGDYLVEMMNGEMTYSGEYSIDGDCLRFSMGKGVSGVIYIDRQHRRLMATESEPMTRF